jgi:hypothetical protein
VVLRSQAGPPAWGDPSGVNVLRTCFAALRPQLGAPLPPSLPRDKRSHPSHYRDGYHVLVTCLCEADLVHWVIEGAIPRPRLEEAAMPLVAGDSD